MAGKGLVLSCFWVLTTRSCFPSPRGRPSLDEEVIGQCSKRCTKADIDLEKGAGNNMEREGGWDEMAGFRHRQREVVQVGMGWVGMEWNDRMWTRNAVPKAVGSGHWHWALGSVGGAGSLDKNSSQLLGLARPLGAATITATAIV